MEEERKTDLLMAAPHPAPEPRVHEIHPTIASRFRAVKVAHYLAWFCVLEHFRLNDQFCKTGKFLSQLESAAW